MALNNEQKYQLGKKLKRNLSLYIDQDRNLKYKKTYFCRCDLVTDAGTQKEAISKFIQTMLRGIDVEQIKDLIN